MSSSRNLVLIGLLIVLSGAVYLVGNGSVALWDRDEPRYAQTSRQMLQSGDWVVPHFLDKARTAKPALIYWCQAASMMVFGDNNFAARFPSAVATTLLLIVLAAVLWKPLGSELTIWTVFIFATSGLTIAAAKMCITDAVLLLWITVAQVCLYLFWRGNRKWSIVIIYGIVVGLAALTKGPIILGMQATTLICLAFIAWLNRKFPPMGYTHSEPTLPLPRETTLSIALKIIVALLLIAAIFLPWVLMVNHRSKNFIQTAVWHEVWDRMMTPLEQHVGPPGYYFLTIWITFFPWSLLLPMAIGSAIYRRGDPRVRFALSAIIGPWIMLECFRTKLPHYLLPVFPPLAFLTASALLRCIRGEQNDLRSGIFRIVVTIWAILVALGLSLPWLLVGNVSPLPIKSMIVLSVVGLLVGIAVYESFRAKQIARGAVAMGLGTFAIIASLYIGFLPRANFLRLSPRLACDLIEHDVTHPNQVLMLEYMEPSLAFAQGGTIREAGELGFSKHFEPRLTPWLVLPESIWNNAPADLRADYDIVKKERGLAYADHGKWVTVLIIHRKER